MIGDIVAIPPDQQVLTHVVKDGCELWNTHIQDGDTLYVEKKESQCEETRRQVQQIRAAAHADTGKQVLKHFLWVLDFIIVWRISYNFWSISYEP